MRQVMNAELAETEGERAGIKTVFYYDESTGRSVKITDHLRSV